jgi:hypothetical protein
MLLRFWKFSDESYGNEMLLLRILTPPRYLLQEDSRIIRAAMLLLHKLIRDNEYPAREM